MRSVLDDDQRWYLRGGVKQHGAVKIVETRVLECSDVQAVVQVTLDATAVTVTAKGEKTFVDYSRLIITRFILERRDTWRITATESDD